MRPEILLKVIHDLAAEVEAERARADAAEQHVAALQKALAASDPAPSA